MSKNIESLRDQLFATLAELRDKDKPLELDRAKAIVDVAGVIVETAKVEVAFLKVTGALKSTDFIPDGDDAPRLPAKPNGQARLNGGH